MPGLSDPTLTCHGSRAVQTAETQLLPTPGHGPGFQLRRPHCPSQPSPAEAQCPSRRGGPAQSNVALALRAVPPPGGSAMPPLSSATPSPHLPLCALGLTFPQRSRLHRKPAPSPSPRLPCQNRRALCPVCSRTPSLSRTPSGTLSPLHSHTTAPALPYPLCLCSCPSQSGRPSRAQDPSTVTSRPQSPGRHLYTGVGHEQLPALHPAPRAISVPGPRALPLWPDTRAALWFPYGIHALDPQVQPLTHAQPQTHFPRRVLSQKQEAGIVPPAGREQPISKADASTRDTPQLLMKRGGALRAVCVRGPPRHVQ